MGSDGLRLRVLGCAGGYPGPGSACSGYLLEAAGQRVWVDAGGGTLAEIQRHWSLADLDAIWISHLHPDHCTDLPLAFHVLSVGGVRGGRRLPVLGPSGWSRHMDAFVAEPGAMASVFDVVELSDAEQVAFGELSMLAVATVPVARRPGGAARRRHLTHARAGGRVRGGWRGTAPGADAPAARRRPGQGARAGRGAVQR
jgi:glyoxylase-like metal-dependent hydrolase (beta-lactamase superfamily II)